MTSTTAHAQWRSEVLALAEMGVAACEVAAPTADGSCSCRLRDDCPSPGKHPLGRAWNKRATTKPRRVAALTRVVPALSYGLIPQAGSGVIVIDLDEPDDEVLALMPETYVVSRPSAPTGRAHYYLTVDPADEDQVPRVFAGGEVRVAGSGHVVGPGCRHASGDTYESNGKAVAAAPEALLDTLRARPPMRAGTNVDGGGVAQGDRHPWLAGQARKMAGWGWDLDRVADGLRELNDEHCVPPLSERAAEFERIAAWAVANVAPDRPVSVRRRGERERPRWAR